MYDYNTHGKCTGKAGLMSRLFGSVDTEEVRELKILRLEHRITQQNEIVKQVDEDLKYIHIYFLLSFYDS